MHPAASRLFALYGCQVKSIAFALLVAVPFLLADGPHMAAETPQPPEAELIPLREDGWAYVPARPPRAIGRRS